MGDDATENVTAGPTPADAPPASGLELRSTVADDGTVTLALGECEVPAPGDRQVIVRIEAAPINPSDLGMMFAGADPETSEAVDVGGRPGVSLTLSDRARDAARGRLGAAMPVGNEAGGVVVAAGSSPDAQALLGRTVGIVTGDTYAQYRAVDVASCLAMPDGTTSEQAAAPFVNPLTALGMVETMRAEGHTALVHTVGASNLGRMLVRLCRNDGVGLVNIVRRPEHVDVLRELGAEYVCDSSAATFRDDLVEALRATGATIAFDAIGGGDMASTLLSCMERVAGEQAAFSRYGSSTHKQVYIYGGLDRGPTVLRRDFGMSWGVGGWLLTPFLAKAGAETTARLRRRVAEEITTTFASGYGLRISLRDAVDPDRVRHYARIATGEKALILPQA